MQKEEAPMGYKMKLDLPVTEKITLIKNKI